MVKVNVNGADHQYDGDPNMPLLWFVRDELGLPGTKFGCGAGLCGACTVHLNGEAVRSCMTTLADAAGKKVVTIEGLSPDGNHPVQIAWRELSVPQCGFCQAGQIMQASGLLAQNQSPSDAEILEAMSGNICRCGCYQRIVGAVRQAATGA
jgi:isoquinoline 1-oxidoreductase subunit alpha